MNVAACPAVTALLDGCVEIAGATEVVVDVDDLFTVRVAELLVVLPTELLTLTVKSEPLSVRVSAGVVYEADVAPLIGTVFFIH